VNIRPLHIGVLVVVAAVIAVAGGVLLGKMDRSPAAQIYARGTDNLAIDGYDTVAYFTEGRAVRGAKEYRQTWAGADWWFATAEARELFASDPGRYAPAYGSYCAMGMAEGKLSVGDPEAWFISDGRLYLVYDQATLDAWGVDMKAHIAAANANWSHFGDLF
jgi:hypothetical protein